MITAKEAHAIAASKYESVFADIEKAAKQNNFMYVYTYRCVKNMPDELQKLLSDLGYDVDIQEEIEWDQDHYGNIIEDSGRTLYTITIHW